jgi:glycogen operon protein
MLLAGDEISHTQQGNNNAYCQDNELTWLNWKLDERQEALLAFTRRLIQLYHEEPILHRRRFFHGKSLHGEQSPEIAWLDPTGKEMSAEQWKTPHMRCLGVHLMGGRIDVDEYGEPIIGDHLLILFNADHAQDIAFALPELAAGSSWERLFDTATGFVDAAAREEAGEDVSAASAYKLAPCSMAVFRAPAPEEAEASNNHKR